jgi:hypothetical protein
MTTGNATTNELKSVIRSLGIKATTYEETLHRAGFDWEVMEEEIVSRRSGATFTSKKMLLRSDTQEPLGLVGADYKASDPRKFLHNQYAMANILGGDVYRAGWTGKGSKAFSIIKLHEKLVLPANVREVGDTVGLFIYSTEAWDGGSPSASSLFFERLVCKNGMKTQELSAGFRVSHTKNAEDRFKPAMRLFVNEVEEKSNMAQDQFVKLAKTRMGVSEVEQFLENLIPGDTTTAENKREAISKLFTAGVGNEGKTRWDAFNAVTQWVTHHAPYRETSVASVDTSRFLGVLERNQTNERALNLLLSFAE